MGIMPRFDRLSKGIFATLVPVLLVVLLAFQLHHYKWILILRNHYLVESLPRSSTWVWDALSGNIHLPDVPNEVAVSDNNKKSIDSSSVLMPGLSSLTVHLIWCVDGYFELSHYISVRSILLQLRPDNIIIHYRSPPRRDPKGYWRWLEDLQRDIVILSLKQLSNPKYCSHLTSSGIDTGTKDFPDPHGVFILNNVVLHNFTRNSVKDILNKSFTEKSHVKPISESQVYIVGGSEPHHITQRPGHVVVKCQPVTQFNTNPYGAHCIDMNTYFSPEDVYNRDTHFYKYARQLLFDTKEPVKVATALQDQIPKFVHIILSNGAEITPLLYISIKSAFVIGQVDQVLLHGPKHPIGELWAKLLNQDQLIPQYVPTAEFNQFSNKHGEFVYAFYNLLLHGGMTHFGDIVFVQSLPTSILKAPAISTHHYSQYRMKHRSLNTAIIAAAQGSKFIESVLAMVKQAADTWPEATVDEIATHIEESHPSLVLLDGSLTSHQHCASNICRVAGGHAYPQGTYTTRLLWSGEQPDSLEKLKAYEGPSRNVINEILEKSNHSP